MENCALNRLFPQEKAYITAPWSLPVTLPLLKNYQTIRIGSHLFLSLYRVPGKCSSIQVGEFE
jgi:hypothetical protein